MSGIFIVRGDRDLRAVAAARRLSFTHWTHSHTAQAGGFSFALTWIGPRDFVPLHSDLEHQVVLCMLGRLYDLRDDVRLDKRLRRVAAEYRARGPAGLKTGNGAGALVLFDKRKDTCHIVTDRCAFFPLYAAFAQDARKTAVCSHTDVLAASYDEDLVPDELGMAAAIFNGAPLHPSTLYREMQFLDAATVYEWSPAGLRAMECYWRPEPRIDPSATPAQLGEALAAAIAASVNLRFREAEGGSGLMLSGGLDSRSMLFAARPPRDAVMALTFADAMNEETQIAARVAARAGVRHEVMYRSAEYYAEIMSDAARISGGLWDLAHAHSTGFTEPLHGLGLNLIVSGFLSDILFRGNKVDTTTVKRRFLGPKRVLAPLGSRTFHKAPSPEGSPYAAEILAQREALYGGIEQNAPDEADRLSAEFRHFYPDSTRPALVEMTVPWRTLPFDLPATDHRVLDLVCTIPPSHKINGDVMIEALKRLPGKPLGIAYSNTGTHPTAPAIIQAVERWRRKRAERRWKREGVTIGSWGSWVEFVKRSRLLKELWFDNRERCERIVAPLLGMNPYEFPYEEWARDARSVRMFRRCLSLMMWDKHRIRRGSA